MPPKKHTPGFQVWLEVDGRHLLGSQEAQILAGIKKLGSFMATAKALGISYAHAWNVIDNVRSILGEPIVEAKKGGEYGGGAKLTEAGLKILGEYYDLERRIGQSVSNTSDNKPRAELFELKTELPEFTIIGSDCVGINILVQLMLAEKKFSYEVVSVGSSGGLTAIMLGEADVAGIHLLDEETGEYNVPFLKRYWIADKAVLVKGYQRDTGLILAKDNPKHIRGIEDLLRPDVRFVNRSLGSGTRTLLDHFLKRIGDKKGLKFRDIVGMIKGYPVEARSHGEVADAVLNRKADVALGIKGAAKMRGLDYISIAQESFDFVIEEKRLNKPLVEFFIEKLSSEGFANNLRQQDIGLTNSKDTGTIIYRP